MSPMPPPMPAPAGCFSGASATIASVVRMFFAIDAAFWSAELDDGESAGELREPLLELLAVEVGVGVLDLGLELLDPALDRVGVTGAVDDRRRVLVDDDAAGAAELRELRVLELEPHLLGD